MIPQALDWLVHPIIWLWVKMEVIMTSAKRDNKFQVIHLAQKFSALVLNKLICGVLKILEFLIKET